jgi:hypothetical protein
MCQVANKAHIVMIITRHRPELMILRFEVEQKKTIPVREDKKKNQ